MAQWWRIHLPVQETWVRNLAWEDPLEEEMAIPSSILAWRIPWTEEPGGLQSIGLHRVGHSWACVHLWVTSGFSLLSIMLQWSSLYIHLRGFVGLFCPLYYLRVSRSRKCLFKILLGISKLSSSWFYQTPIIQAVKYSLSSCFPSIPGLYNSHTFKWSVSALAQDVQKGESYPSPDFLSANQEQKA